MRRRRFLKLSATGITAATLASCGKFEFLDNDSATKTKPLATQYLGDMPWLGKNFWANRLQDWKQNKGWLECITGEENMHVRTAHILTRSLNKSKKSARIRATIKKVDIEGEGFAGFLLGAGGGDLDYRSASLIHYGAGKNGGLIAAINHKGELQLRDFSDSNNPLKFDQYVIDEKRQNEGLSSFSDTKKAIILDCNIDPSDTAGFDLRLIAYDAETGEELGFIAKSGIKAEQFQGNIALVSSPQGKKGTRFALKNIETGGPKIDVHAERALGPVIGCLHSLNQTVLKLTAQFVPIKGPDWDRARFDYRQTSEKDWTQGPIAEIGAGFAALFRIDNWNPQEDFEYRIVFPSQKADALFSGTIRRDPGAERPLKIALHSCLLPTSRPIDRPTFSMTNSLEEGYDRYDKKSLVFPHTQLTEGCLEHDPDLYVFLGDQYYETYPTRPGRSGEFKELDTLYRWYLWFLTFRDSVRDRPCILLADDHDVLQGNIWGNGGDASFGPTEEDGGFKYDLDLVRMIYRMQCGHNPDNFDNTPIKNNIPVTYGRFVYGGTSIAFVEDRKWKTPPNVNKDVPLEQTRGDLLGARQEAFLAEWKNMDVGLPKVCLTASIWGSPQTDKDLSPLVDYDANGYPPDGRRRGIELLRNANALAISGDQHLGMVARQGVDDYEDGPVFFAGPAGAAFWQRWFEGRGRLDNQFQNNKNTGNFIDCFGNKMRVLAVANPKVTHETFLDANNSWGYFVGDRDLKSEGYGLVKIDHDTQSFVLECWPWDAKPKQDTQFYGWPITVPFDKAGKA